MKDDDVRALLHHAVDDVQPRADRTEVLARLAADDERQSRRRLAPALAAAAAVAVVVAGLGWLQHSTPPPRPAATSVGHDVSLAVYYVGDTSVGPRLFSERHVLHGVVTSDAQAAFDQLLARPDDPDYRAPFPAGTSAAVRVDGDTVTVDFPHGDLATAPAGSPPGSGAAAAQAVVWTLDDVLQRPVDVRFTEQGRPMTALLGSRLDGPVAQGSADQVLSPVSVNLPEGAQLASGTTIRGQAAAFEANVVWELLQAGKVVEHGYTTAGQCCTLSAYAFVLQAPAGDYELVVHDSDPSGGEGPGPTTDTKDIEIR